MIIYVIHLTFYLPTVGIVLQCPGGTENLWELVAVTKGLDDSLLSSKYSKGIMHMKHLTMFQAVCPCFLAILYGRVDFFQKVIKSHSAFPRSKLEISNIVHR